MVGARRRRCVLDWHNLLDTTLVGGPGRLPEPLEVCPQLVLPGAIERFVASKSAACWKQAHGRVLDQFCGDDAKADQDRYRGGIRSDFPAHPCPFAVLVSCTNDFVYQT